MKPYLPHVFFVVLLLWVLGTFKTPRTASDFDLASLGRLPVLVNGRVKPFDSVARNALLVLQGRQGVVDASGRKLSPSEWLFDCLTRPEKADALKVIEIAHPDLLALTSLSTDQGEGGKRFSFQQIQGKLAEIERQARIASQTEAPARSTFQRAVLQLHSNLLHYQGLRHSLVPPDAKDLLSELREFESILGAGLEAVRAKEAGQSFDEKSHKEILEFANRFGFLAETAQMLIIPPPPGAPPEAWTNMGQALQSTFGTGHIPPPALAWAGLAVTWQKQKAVEFNAIARLYEDQLAASQAQAQLKAKVETRFNSAQPFYTANLLFGLAFLLALLSWIVWPDTLRRFAFQAMTLAFALTTLGIMTRMWLEGRPPVTNLYSSALGVAWAAVALCLVLEAIFKNAIGSAAGGFAGLCALIVAHHLSLGGDTMEMMRAVLDSNFWLATHVVTITVGYAATFLAGFLALIFVFRGVLTKSLDRETSNTLMRMIYGIVAFATLFSLVGTILGGIWADQSWGRFWGWDPKENGALMIVLWNAIFLHARWGGLVKQRGLAALAIFGNVITAWSWFGVNMLGVGLHSYGFMDAAFWWLLAFVLSQVIAIGLTALPPKYWRSGL